MIETTAVELADSYRYCRDLAKAEAKNFYYTFWLLPPDRRSAIFAIYAFSRRLDDIADGDFEGAGAGRGEVDARRELDYMLSMLGDDPPRDDPLVPALQDSVRRFGIPREPFDDLVAGMVMDLENYRYRTFDDLRLYCYRAASTVGLICVEIFGHDSPASEGGAAAAVREPAVDLGLAMQLTNILRDIPEDLARDRVYLPADELHRFGLGRESLESAKVTDAFREFMDFQIKRARGYFCSAESLFPHLRPDTRFCPVLLKRIYSELLDRIEKSDYDVFNERPRLSNFRKAYLAGSWWLRSLFVRR